MKIKSLLAFSPTDDQKAHGKDRLTLPNNDSSSDDLSEIAKLEDILNKEEESRTKRLENHLKQLDRDLKNTQKIIKKRDLRTDEEKKKERELNQLKVRSYLNAGSFRVAKKQRAPRKSIMNIDLS